MEVMEDYVEGGGDGGEDGRNSVGPQMTPVRTPKNSPLHLSGDIISCKQNRNRIFVNIQ